MSGNASKTRFLVSAQAFENHHPAISSGASVSAFLGLSAQTLTGHTGAQLDCDAILHHLNAVITWYRDATTRIKSVVLPSDAIYQDNARNPAAETVRLAFQSARAEELSSTLRTRPTAPARLRHPALHRPSNSTSHKQAPR
jgi:hypothetical protein